MCTAPQCDCASRPAPHSPPRARCAARRPNVELVLFLLDLATELCLGQVSRFFRFSRLLPYRKRYGSGTEAVRALIWAKLGCKAAYRGQDAIQYVYIIDR